MATTNHNPNPTPNQTPADLNRLLDRGIIRAEDLLNAYRAGNASRVEGQVGKEVRRCLVEAVHHPERTRSKAMDAIGCIEHVPVAHFSEELGDLRRLLVQITESPALPDEEAEEGDR